MINFNYVSFVILLIYGPYFKLDSKLIEMNFFLALFHIMNNKIGLLKDWVHYLVIMLGIKILLYQLYLLYMELISGKKNYLF